MGKLIVFEGIDGSGKSTQFNLLCKRLTAVGIKFTRLVFPQYDQPSSALIRMYLNGAFGQHPEDVNAYAASTFFAVDRFASYKQIWQNAYEQGELILSDRYTTSNAVHQGSKLPKEARIAYFDWLYDFEFHLLGLPAPDVVIYMDTTIQIALEQMEKRRQETGTQGDIHELDIPYLTGCLDCAQDAARHFGWYRLSCLDAGRQRGVEELHEEIYEYLQRTLLLGQHA